MRSITVGGDVVSIGLARDYYSDLIQARIQSQPATRKIRTAEGTS